MKIDSIFRIIKIPVSTIVLILSYPAVAVFGQTAPVSYPDQPACQVKSVQELPTAFQGIMESPAPGLWAATQYDVNGVGQLYTSKPGGNGLTCITCTPGPGAPGITRNKYMTVWHPSAQWLSVGVEENNYFWSWLPQLLKRGFLQSGVWMNMWITTPTGNRWYQMTNFGDGGNGTPFGFTGPAWTPDGQTAVWAEMVDGLSSEDVAGVWRLYTADFYVSRDGVPNLVNKTDITPAGARWIEPGNFSPDGRHLLLNTDIGLTDAEGQDQWSLDIETGTMQNLTNSPTVWDEHGLYSPSGKKISFMSSYPYRSDPTSYKTFSLKTEFMLIDAGGGHLQQLTHFNVPGYPESQRSRTVAAIAWFMADGTQLYGMTMNADFTGTSWIITFAGRCGAQ
jgi:hypothetical protein